MDPFDLVIRGGTVATAADTFPADVGIRDGRIVALAHDLGEGREEIDAAGKARAARWDRQSLPHRAVVVERSALRGRLLLRLRLRRVRGHHHHHPVRRAAPRAVAARGGGGLPRLRGPQGGRRLRLPSHHLRPHRADPRPGASRPHRGRLQLVQGVHDLRPAPARRLPDARRALARTARGRDDHGPRREPRHDPLAHRSASRRRTPGAEVPCDQPCPHRGERSDEPGHRPREAHRRPDAHRARVGSRGGRRHPPRPGSGASDLRRDVSAVPVPDRRGTSTATAWRARSSAAARRPATRRTRSTCGAGS